MSYRDEHRQLAAIMFTDIVGFTTLMSESEASALDVLRRSRLLVRQLTRRFRGRWLETVGDGNLIRFASATDAVNCALTIQKRLLKDADIRLRIGIHVGDVIEAGGHIYGDGVNVASRIEGLAEPGGIVVSETVYDAVRNKAGIRADKLGAQHLEGLDHPMQAYALSGETVGSPLLGRIALPDKRRWGLALVLVSIALAGILSVGIYTRYVDVQSGNATIAVLPFADMSPSGDQEYFSDGLAEEILNLLAQIRELRVIGRTSSFAFKGRDVDLREIGETLGVSHLLEGSVRKDGDDLRITAQLVQVDDGSHLWSRSYDRRLENVFAIQAEIAKAIADALQVSLVGPEDTTPVPQATASIPAYERFLHARRLIQGRGRPNLEAARDLLEEALELDPDYAPSYAAAAQAVLSLSDSPGTHGDIPIDEAAATAQPLIDRALALDPQLAEAHAVQGLLFLLQRDFARSEAALARALELNPSLSDALLWRAGNLGLAGRLREALDAQRRLAEIDPLNRANLFNLAWSLLISGESTEADALAQRTQRRIPGRPGGFIRQAQIQLWTGRLAEARALAERALAMSENAFMQRHLAGVFYALGDYDRVLALPAADEQLGPALLALGRNDEALAQTRERAAAAPGNFSAAYSLLRTLSLAGRHDEVLAVYRERWGDLAGLDAAFRFDMQTSELAPIAAAQRALGRHEALAETLQHWGERLAFMREHGYAYSRVSFTEASHLALSGEHASALAKLAEAIDLGYRDPLLDIDPSFTELHDDPAFQAQVARMTNLINVEREKLGMDLLP